MDTKKIKLTPKYTSYNWLISIAYVIISIPFFFLLFYWFSWNLKYLYIIIILTFLLCIVEFISQVVKKKSYFVMLKEDRIIISKGVIFHSRIEVFYSKIYSIEYKQNVISQKFDYYQISFRTTDMEFSITGISQRDREEISKFISARIL